MLVTIDEARNHLRIDGSDDDAWLAVWIPAISQAILLWLKDSNRAYETEVDSNGDTVIIEDSNGPIVRPIVKSSVLVELASQYRFREGEGVAQVPAHWGHGYTLSVGATSLLTPLRRSTVA